jgi:haloalkane dehalogenase
MNEHPWIDRQEYPFPSHYLALGMGRLHYLDEGAGEPVVMVHGNPAWSFLYRHFIKGLSAEVRCVAPDHIGFGLSDKPLEWSYRPLDHARNLQALIEHLGLRNITLVVQDWGGPIGLSYAVNQPDNVKSLVLMNTWMWPVDDDWYYRAFSGFMGGPLGRFLIQRYNFFVNGVMKMATADKSRLPRAVHQHYVQPLANPAERKGCWTLPKEIIASSDWLKELWERRAQIADKPVLILWGLKDIAFRQKELQTWLALFGDCQVHRLQGVGHFVQEEYGREAAPILAEFLRAHSQVGGDEGAA